MLGVVVGMTKPGRVRSWPAGLSEVVRGVAAGGVQASLAGVSWRGSLKASGMIESGESVWAWAGAVLGSLGG